MIYKYNTKTADKNIFLPVYITQLILVVTSLILSVIGVKEVNWTLQIIAISLLFITIISMIVETIVKCKLGKYELEIKNKEIRLNTGHNRKGKYTTYVIKDKNDVKITEKHSWYVITSDKEKIEKREKQKKNDSDEIINRLTLTECKIPKIFAVLL